MSPGSENEHSRLLPQEQCESTERTLGRKESNSPVCVPTKNMSVTWLGCVRKSRQEWTQRRARKPQRNSRGEMMGGSLGVPAGRMASLRWEDEGSYGKGRALTSTLVVSSLSDAPTVQICHPLCFCFCARNSPAQLPLYSTVRCILHFTSRFLRNSARPGEP